MSPRPATRIRNQPNGETTGTGCTRVGCATPTAGTRDAVAPVRAGVLPDVVPDVVAGVAGAVLPVLAVLAVSVDVLVVRSAGVAMGESY
jgi:hypothetical protein